MECLLVLSDVHLGSDLNEIGHPMRRSHRVDGDLVKLLVHYRDALPAGEHWRLVIAGDFIDFVGMAVRAEEPDLVTEPNDEERQHGLGSAVDHVRRKLRRVVERHADAFDALAAFVADGHAVTFVHGNHDVELHWDAVKDDLRSHLLARASVNRAIDGPPFLGRIAFESWFFYAPGLAYIEHGHQYDTFCASQHALLPLSADPRRIARSCSDVLLRFVVRPTRGMREYGHEKHGVSHYLAFAANLGIAGTWQLAQRYLGAIGELFRLHRELLAVETEGVREQRDRKMVHLATATCMGVERVRALAALHAAPVTSTVRGVLASVLLDRLALGFAGAVALAVVAALTAMHVLHAWWTAPSIALVWAFGLRRLSRRRTVDPAERMVQSAARVAQVLPAAFIVMGHTHTPAKVALNGGRSTYFNLGSWAEEEGDDGEPPADETYRAARTHLVIQRTNGRALAEFLEWDGSRPRPYRPGTESRSEVPRGPDGVTVPPFLTG